MKRIIAVSALLVILVFLSACDQKNTPTAPAVTVKAVYDYTLFGFGVIHDTVTFSKEDSLYTKAGKSEGPYAITESQFRQSVYAADFLATNPGMHEIPVLSVSSNIARPDNAKCYGGNAYATCSCTMCENSSGIMTALAVFCGPDNGWLYLLDSYKY